MNDILRIMAELHTFTSDDLADAQEITRSAANAQLEQFIKKRLVVRIRAGKSFLYALSETGKKRAQALPAIDLDERALLLVRVVVTERYMHHRGTPVLDTSEDELPVIAELCRGCGELYVNLPIAGRCTDCERAWHS